MLRENVTQDFVFFLFKLYFPDFSREHFESRATAHEKAQWLYLLVFQARFELISHFLFRPYSNYIKTGVEFLQGLAMGQGGVCLERVLGLKLLLELFEVGECSFAMGGSLPGTHEPIDLEEVELNLKDPEKSRISPYAHHAAVILSIDGQDWLLDPNGGRLGMIFLNPSLTEKALSSVAEEKIGMAASFGQMFYHRVPDDLFHLLVAYRKTTAVEALDLICLIGLLVGPNFDVFIIPKDNYTKRFPALYAHRAQTLCWGVHGKLSTELKNKGLVFEKVFEEDLFYEKIDGAFDVMNQFSLDQRGQELQMVLRVSNKDWAEYTRPSPVLSSSLMMV